MSEDGFKTSNPQASQGEQMRRMKGKGNWMRLQGMAALQWRGALVICSQKSIAMHSHQISDLLNKDIMKIK